MTVRQRGRAILAAICGFRGDKLHVELQVNADGARVNVIYPSIGGPAHVSAAVSELVIRDLVRQAMEHGTDTLKGELLKAVIDPARRLLVDMSVRGKDARVTVASGRLEVEYPNGAIAQAQVGHPTVGA